MSEELLGGAVTLHHGDSREVLKLLPSNSVDSVVTDPPYALVSIVKRFGGPNAAPASDGDVYARASAGFMGQKWDTGETAFAVEFWAEVMRVLKPGGHVIAFSGTRTYHRLAVAIEDAGFEIRDMISWLYGSGFPKSHDVSKGIAKRRVEDVEPARVVCRFIRAAMDAQGLKSRDLTQHFNDCDPRLIDHWAARDTDSQPSLPTPEQWAGLKVALSLSDDMDAEVARLNARKGDRGEAWTEAEVVGEVESAPAGFGDMRFGGDRTIRSLGGEAAQWQGWGTALKPACEPCVLARKPLAGTVAANVLAHGTGALNIDACRVEAPGEKIANHGHSAEAGKSKNALGDFAGIEPHQKPGQALGRWPANVVHDGSDEVVAGFPETSPSPKGLITQGGDHFSIGSGAKTRGTQFQGHGDSGSAARFFYSAKADSMDRIGSKHPTVKPVDLMQWMVRLVTPPGGVVLDPFAGSGTTGEAAFREGFKAILIEREADYCVDIRARMDLAASGEKSKRRAIAKRKGGDEPVGGLFG